MSLRVSANTSPHAKAMGPLDSVTGFKLHKLRKLQRMRLQLKQPKLKARVSRLSHAASTIDRHRSKHVPKPPTISSPQDLKAHQKVSQADGKLEMHSEDGPGFFLPRAMFKPPPPPLVPPTTDKCDPLQMIPRIQAMEDSKEQISNITEMMELYGMHDSLPADRLDEMTDCGWLARRITRSAYFNYIVATAVFMNVCVTVVEVDYQHEHPDMFQQLHITFTFVFLFELILRYVARSRVSPLHPRPPPDQMLTFDSLLVAISLIELMVVDVFGDDDAQGVAYIMALRGSRLLRFGHMMRFAKSLRSMTLLSNAIHGCWRPLFFAILMLLVMVFTLALMLTSFVPLVATESAGAVVAEVCGSLGSTTLVLLEATTGSIEWGPQTVFPILEEGIEDNFWSKIFAFMMVLAILGLNLGCTGLMTGIFLDQINQAELAQEELDWETVSSQGHGVLHGMDEMFLSMGHGLDERISSREFAAALKEHPEVPEALGMSADTALKLFWSLDEHGVDLVKVDDLTFSVFKLSSISKSVDMFSIDYQQDKALGRLRQLRRNVRLVVLAAEKRMSRLDELVFELRERFDAVRAEFAEVRCLEAQLEQKTHDFALDLRELFDDPTGKTHVSSEILRLDFELHSKLSKLEGVTARLLAAGPNTEAPDAVAAAAVDSARDILRHELHALTAGGHSSPSWLPPPTSR